MNPNDKNPERLPAWLARAEFPVVVMNGNLPSSGFVVGSLQELSWLVQSRAFNVSRWMRRETAHVSELWYTGPSWKHMFCAMRDGEWFTEASGILEHCDVSFVTDIMWHRTDTLGWYKAVASASMQLTAALQLSRGLISEPPPWKLGSQMDNLRYAADKCLQRVLATNAWPDGTLAPLYDDRRARITVASGGIQLLKPCVIDSLFQR